MPPENLTGRKFGILVAEKVVGASHRGRQWQCRCECGKIVNVYANTLRSGHTRSCGCLRGEKFVATVDNLKRLMNYDPETGIFTYKEAKKYKRQGLDAGSLNHKGYLIISIGRKRYMAHKLAWFYVYGQWPAIHLDHVDRNKLNNTIENLRLATPSQNQANREKQRNNISGVKGVYKPKGFKKWVARISAYGEAHYLGCFENINDAAKAYDTAAIELFGEFARPNA